MAMPVIIKFIVTNVCTAQLYHTMNELRNQTRTKESSQKKQKKKTTMNTPHSMPKGQRATETVYTHTINTPGR